MKLFNKPKLENKKTQMLSYALGKDGKPLFKNLRLPQFNLNKSVMLVTFLVVVLFCLVFTYFSINTAKPGDLLYTAKLFKEKLTAPNNLVTKIDFSTKAIEDRTKNYVEVAKSNNCVQLVAVESELVRYFQEYWALQTQITEAALYNSFLGKGIDALSGLDNIEETSCTISNDLLGLQLVVAVEQLRFVEETNQTQIDTIKDKYQALTTKYSDTKKSLKNEIFQDQQTLNQINNLLVNAHSYLLIVDESIQKGNYDDLPIRLKTIELDLVNIQNIKDKKTLINWESPVAAICLLKKDAANCAQDELLGRWNSVSSQTDASAQISKGEEVFRTYLAEIIHNPQP